MTTSAADPAIEASGLSRRFGSAQALQSVDLSVGAGSVYGLLGPNGAGKTTTIRILTTLLLPDEGSARVFGHDIVREAAAVRRHLSLTGQFASIDGELTATENLVLMGRLLGLARRQARVRAGELLASFELSDAGGRQVRGLSGGMRRRLDIAASLITRPRLLFLDEPTTGLDPASRQQTWQLVRGIVAEGTTVVLTTQYLEEADQLSDRIAVIDRGRLIAEGTSAELKAAVGGGSLRVRLASPARRVDAERILAAALGATVRSDSDPVGLTATLAAGGGEAATRAARALEELSACGIDVNQFALGQPTLDEAFLALTSRPTQIQAA